MLHIILLILKIIGIILAVILGILVLLICIVLFVPLKYEVWGSCEGTPETIDFKIKFSWLLHLIAGYASYHEQKVQWQMRILWRKLNVPENPEPAEKVLDEAEEGLEQAASKVTAFAEEEEDIREISWDTETDEESDAGKEEEEPEGIFGKLYAKVMQIVMKIKVFFLKIKYTFTKICDNIKVLLRQKEILTKFVKYEAHQRALKKALRELKYLLRKLKPKRFEADVRFGFEDPYITGQVLAGLSMVYPFIGEYTSIRPDFENKVLTGQIYIKGNIRMSCLVWAALRLMLNRDVRTTYRHIKNMNLKG